MPRIILLYLCALILQSFTTAAMSEADKTNLKQTNTFFIKNIGQIRDQFGNSRKDIDFKIQTGSGLNVFIGANAIHYQWTKKSENNTKSSPRYTLGKIFMGLSDLNVNNLCSLYRMDVALIGANPNAILTTGIEQDYYEQYYLPSVLEGNRKANSYGKIIYKEVYPFIDWELYFNSDGKLEHDFVIHPGGNPSDIKIKYEGCTGLQINENGSLTATTPLGIVKENAPIVFEKDTKRKVTSAFQLRGNMLSFSISPYKGTLVIDPTLEWGTYFGGTEYDQLKKVAINKYGSVFAVGSTNSATNIVTSGAFQTIFMDGNPGSNYNGGDAVVTKFNKAGKCIWATYYGGHETDLGVSVTTDTAGDVYLCGMTASDTGMVTTGCYQPVRAGAWASFSRVDGFLVKFDTSGNRLWGTYIGGSNDGEYNNKMDLTADRNGNIYLTMGTMSEDMIVSPNAHQSKLAGSIDVFLMKFNTTGKMTWATYYGGTGDDNPNSLTADIDGNVYITGYTFGSNAGIATTGSFQSSYSAITNGQDAYLAKFNPAGELLWATYYGSTEIDQGSAVFTDANANVYMGGVTLSTKDISTSGSYQASYGGGVGGDGFLVKFDSKGKRKWATYYGGENDDLVSSGFIDNNNQIYISGLTRSNSNIATSDGIQTSFGGGYSDLFVARFDTSGNRAWGSYYGGLDYEMSSSIKGDVQGNVFICGEVNSSTNIATAGSHQGTFGGGDMDGFILRIKDCQLANTPTPIIGRDTMCAGEMALLYTNSNNATAYRWLMPSGWEGMSNSDSIQITFGNNSGIIRVVAINDCGASDTANLAITVLAKPNPTIIRNGKI